MEPLPGDQLSDERRKRLAIIGGGSSGLVSLKDALDALPGWEVVCFEKSSQHVGCWGRPYPGFVSTSTKYTTQFACFPITEAEVNSAGQRTFEEFFREDEYGRYLTNFVERFNLKPHIRLQTQVERLERTDTGQWRLSILCADSAARSAEEVFDAVVICTGLAAEAKGAADGLGRPSYGADAARQLPTLSVAELHSPAGLEHIHDRRIVVLGGGESAVDYAVRLSRPQLRNKVYLSLASGIRVSPRYHPIRGVPSDFLRNRLMLSIHEDLRNWIGQKFVEARINYQERFQRWFPSRQATAVADTDESNAQLIAKQKYWAYLLTKRAKDQLFNMFHNKSDGFLEAVARGEIDIVGLPTNEKYQQCSRFDTDGLVDVKADLLVPAIGYRSTLNSLCSEGLSVRDFYLGCMHVSYDNLFLVGFARPIIGNIPTISEMQARFISGLISGQVPRPDGLQDRHTREAARLARQFPKLNLNAIYPVEMFPYCDELSRWMSVYPTRRAAQSLRDWIVMQLTPATTMHYYLSDRSMRKSLAHTKVYMPAVLIAFLVMLKPVDWAYKVFKQVVRRG